MESNEMISKRLSAVKSQRKIAESEVQRLQNRINQLKRLEDQKKAKIDKAKALSVRFSKKKVEKTLEQFEKQKRLSMDLIELERKKEENRKKVEAGLEYREECMRKIIDERKKSVVEYKDWMKSMEDMIVKQQEAKSGVNRNSKDWILKQKEWLAKERENESRQKAAITQEMWKERICREQNLWRMKNYEREVMQDVDLSILELMQSNRLFDMF